MENKETLEKLNEISAKIDVLTEFQNMIISQKTEIEKIKNNWKLSKQQLNKKYDILKESYKSDFIKELKNIKSKITKYPILTDKDVKKLRPKEVKYLQDKMVDYTNFIIYVIDNTIEEYK